MDLWRAGTPELTPGPGSNAAGGGPDGQVDGGATAGSLEFSITWDRYRLFRSSTHEEAVRWVNTIREVQAQRPPPEPIVPNETPAFISSGGGPQSPLQMDGGRAEDWGSAGKASKNKRRGADAAKDGDGGCCTIM